MGISVAHDIYHHIYIYIYIYIRIYIYIYSFTYIHTIYVFIYIYSLCACNVSKSLMQIPTVNPVENCLQREDRAGWGGGGGLLLLGYHWHAILIP